MAGLTLAAANGLPLADFVARFGCVFEHGPWVAEAAAHSRPFASAATLAEAMIGCVRTAGAERQDALLRAHPELGGKAATKGRLTADSTAEQASLGLSTLDAAAAARMDELNRRYRGHFGFPFIIAVRGQRDLAAIIAALERRLGHDAATERRLALAEVETIARHRLAALLDEGDR